MKDEKQTKWTGPQALSYARRLIMVVIGFTLLVVGVVMIFLPGPAILVIPIALAILGTEFVWARMLLRKFKQKTDQLREMAGMRSKKEDS